VDATPPDHPTLRKAIEDSGLAVSQIGGPRPRRRMQALETYLHLAATGYGLTRFVLGTFITVPGYGSAEASQVDAERLYQLAQSYPFDELVGSLGELLRPFRSFAAEPCPLRLSKQQAEAFQFAAVLDGARFALAEEEMFQLGAKSQAE
jgi:hypothetical protein